MNNYYTNNLDFNKINQTLETVSSLDTCLKNTDLSSYIIEIENFIKNINFEHNNYIVNYKNPLNNIIDDIEQIKKEINNLYDALSRTITNYQKNFYNDNDIKDLSSIYHDTDFSNIKNSITNFRENILTDIKNTSTNDNITKIPLPQEETEQQPYSTVPIGLGIAATGITAAIGTTIINSNYHDNNKTKEEPILTEVVEIKEEKDKKNNVKDEEVIDYLGKPYHASRNVSEKNIYYNDTNDEYFKY